jgi:hypothetical protein
MKIKSLLTTLIISLIALQSVSLVSAAESPTCDEGDIKNVSVQIDGVWYKRPDALIDGNPSTYSLGPFAVKGEIVEGSEIVAVELYSSIGGPDTVTPMTIHEDNTISGEIPELTFIPTDDVMVFFYLEGLDDHGNVIWLDEIPYTCPPDEYTHGDPYNFKILAREEIDVNIKPNSNTVEIKCDNDNVVVTVAILTTYTFDAANVDHSTVTFEGAYELHVDKKTGEPRRHEEDIDNDGDIDLLFHFRLGETDLTCASTEATITGQTFSGEYFAGTNQITTIGGQ